ncbi:MAG TPA: MmcQ/YjbR family DNA-binding protein [Sphingomicrobium sp.]
MTNRLTSWDEVIAFALTLPSTELSTYFGQPSVKVAANGRAFLNLGREEDSFVLSIDSDSKELLIETEPETYWQTPHYEGWAALLVRFDSKDPDRVAATIERARDQAAAKKPARPRRKRD